MAIGLIKPVSVQSKTKKLLGVPKKWNLLIKVCNIQWESKQITRIGRQCLVTGSRVLDGPGECCTAAYIAMSIEKQK